MALTLHNIQALAHHMHNEDSYLWITKQISQNNFDVQSYDNKGSFLREWHDVDEENQIYAKGDTVKIYKAFKRGMNGQENNNFCMVKVYSVGATDVDQMTAIKTTYLLMKKTNLLHFYGLYYDAQKERVLMTMEPLQQTLRDYVRNAYDDGRRIQETECKLIVSYLLYDLWTLHKTGHIHCDINPSNIMLRDRENEPTLNGWRLIDYENRLFIGTNDDKRGKEVRG
eukprot:142540_1